MYLTNSIESVLTSFSFLDSPQGKILKARIWEAIKLSFCILCYLAYKAGKVYGQTLCDHINRWQYLSCRAEEYNLGPCLGEQSWFNQGWDYSTHLAKKAMVSTAQVSRKVDLPAKVEKGWDYFEKGYTRSQSITHYVLSGIFVYHFQD